MITILLCVSGWLCGWWLFGAPRRVPTPPPTRDVSLRNPGGAPGPGPLAGCTVVIPARDEARQIGGLLADLEPAVDQGLRVVVDDDHSEDDTARVVGGFAGVELVRAGDLPAGWTGKCWACHTGVVHAARQPRPDRAGVDEPDVAHATSPSLVFLDADVRLETAALTSLLALREVRGGLVSVQPWHATEGAVEQLSALFNLVAVMGTGMGAPAGEGTGAFGPVLVTTPEDYARVGGHAAVHSEVVEDLALAASYRNAGLAVELLLGGPELRFRMYPGGLRSLVEGWTKNFASGAAATARRRLLGTVVWIAALGSSFLLAAQSVLGDRPLWLGPAFYALFVAQLWLMLRRVGRFGPLTALAAPVLLLAFFTVFARSVWLTRIRHQVHWRGRSIAVGSRRG